MIQLFYFQFLNVHIDSCLFPKTEFEFQQVGSSKECAHIRNKLQLEMFASALPSSNCSSFNF